MSEVGEFTKLSGSLTRPCLIPGINLVGRELRRLTYFLRAEGQREADIALGQQCGHEGGQYKRLE